MCFIRALFVATYLKKYYQRAVGNISFTADAWSDSNRKPYLCVTAHWVGREKSTRRLVLRSALLAFHRIIGRHDGENMAQALLHILARAGVTHKVCMIYHS
jgi:hypothetical protein